MYDPRTQSSHTYDHHQNHSHSYLAQNFESYSSWSSDQEVVVQFRPNHQQESMKSDDSGVCSPPLWKNSPSPSQPLMNYKSLSPNSRVQAIARGQWELMEMVKNMPESSYELSLKDLVEHHKTEIQAPQVETLNYSDNQSLHQRGVVINVQRQESKKNDKNMMRSGSFEDKGLFLKMAFPFSFNSKKKKKFASNTSGKVSPKPEVLKGGGERDWWKKKFTGSSDSDSSRISNNSGSSGTTGSSSCTTGSSGGSSTGRSYIASRKKNGYLSSCWLFFQSTRSKSVE